MSMLALEVNRLREGEERLERLVQPPELPPEEDYRVVEPVALSVRMTRATSKVGLVGSARTVLELVCGRCLEPYRIPVDAEFDLLYLPFVEAPAGGEELEIAEEDVNTAFYKEGLIDLGEMLHEQLYLALPMKPLCRETCLGLCPVCGANRNTHPCACEPQWEDPRLAALKALLKDDDTHA